MEFIHQYILTWQHTQLQVPAHTRTRIQSARAPFTECSNQFQQIETPFYTEKKDIVLYRTKNHLKKLLKKKHL